MSRSKKRINPRINTRTKTRSNKKTNHGGNVPSEQDKNYYGILGVRQQAKEDEIEEVYQNKMKTFKIDENNSNNETVKQNLENVKSAYKILIDKVARAKYDSTINPYKKEDTKIVANNKPDNESQEELKKDCPSNKDILDAFINDLHESYFTPGDNYEPASKYVIKKDHNVKIRAYPSVFSTDKNPIHLYTKLTDDVKYENFGDQYLLDSFAIEEMFQLINLQQYFRDPYDGADEVVNRTNCDDVNDSEEKKTDKCKNYKKHKKYKKINETTNKIKDFKYKENIKVNKLFDK
jgi:hypothetical protein